MIKSLLIISSALIFTHSLAAEVSSCDPLALMENVDIVLQDSTTSKEFKTTKLKEMLTEPGAERLLKEQGIPKGIIPEFVKELVTSDVPDFFEVYESFSSNLKEIKDRRVAPLVALYSTSAKNLFSEMKMQLSLEANFDRVIENFKDRAQPILKEIGVEKTLAEVISYSRRQENLGRSLDAAIADLAAPESWHIMLAETIGKSQYADSANFGKFKEAANRALESIEVDPGTIEAIFLPSNRLDVAIRPPQLSVKVRLNDQSIKTMNLIIDWQLPRRRGF